MHRLRNRHFLLLDLLLVPLAVYLSFVLRLDRFALGTYWPSALFLTLAAMLVYPVFFIANGIYTRYWRYASLGDLMLLASTICWATLVAGASALLLPFAFDTLPRPPRSVPFLLLFVAMPLLAGARLSLRGVASTLAKRRMAGQRLEPTIIMGAGEAGVTMLRELQNNPRLGMEVVALFDDDPSKHHAYIYGVPVVGDRHAIPRFSQKERVRILVIAMPTASGSAIREIVELAEQASLKSRIMPSLSELLGGNVQVSQLRPVKIEDLLRRAPIQTDTSAIGGLIRNRRVLVTGGGGSIGSEICRQVAAFGPKQLLLLDHSENSVFHITNELRLRFPELDLVSLIADIREPARIRSLFVDYRPEIVFHAAAHKHVPLMEQNPCEAIKNNVGGTRTMVELAERFGVAHFVMISTDKAVNPTNVMGASKRCAELVVQHVAQRSGLPYVAVRFGNVLGSNGSVVPLFQQQIAAGGPLTITHPDMRRFFMTIPEAVQLVLQAAVLGQGGEIFVLDMGEQVRILDLAHDLIELSGLRPGADIEIQVVGMRPGEKLYEELFIEGEVYERTRHQKIFVARSARPADATTLRPHLEQLEALAAQDDSRAIRPQLQRLVPEYQAGSEAPAPSADAGQPQSAATTSTPQGNGKQRR